MTKKIELACVTGASSGIGESLCYLLASKKIDLMIAGRNVVRLNDIANKLSTQVKVHVFPGELTNKEERELLIRNINHYLPDLVINNAGCGLYGDALCYDIEEQLNILKVNGEAVLEITLETARVMREAAKQGIIMNISSAASFTTFPGFAVYSGAKAFVNQFSKSFDIEMQPYGIRILTSCPGMVNTEFRVRASSGHDKTIHRSLMSSEYTAEQIWNQIVSGKQIHIFDWKYRVMLFFAKFLPEKMISKLLYSEMKRRTGKS